mmetsp:Transcript_3349/g.12029  ORF Transcript_3349/g.12029 Transcript_3349/m.12029 type:complete len:552 (-) Transcript_3349:69-1724(-)
MVLIDMVTLADVPTCALTLSHRKYAPLMDSRRIFFATAEGMGVILRVTVPNGPIAMPSTSSSTGDTPLSRSFPAVKEQLHKGPITACAHWHERSLIVTAALGEPVCAWTETELAAVWRTNPLGEVPVMAILPGVLDRKVVIVRRERGLSVCEPPSRVEVDTDAESDFRILERLQALDDGGRPAPEPDQRTSNAETTPAEGEEEAGSSGRGVVRVCEFGQALAPLLSAEEREEAAAAAASSAATKAAARTELRRRRASQLGPDLPSSLEAPAAVSDLIAVGKRSGDAGSASKAPPLLPPPPVQITALCRRPIMRGAVGEHEELMVGCADGSVRVLSARTGAPLRVLEDGSEHEEAPGGAVTSLAYDAWAGLLVVAHAGGLVRGWDAVKQSPAFGVALDTAGAGRWLAVEEAPLTQADVAQGEAAPATLEAASADSWALWTLPSPAFVPNASDLQAQRRAHRQLWKTPDMARVAEELMQREGRDLSNEHLNRIARDSAAKKAARRAEAALEEEQTANELIKAFERGDEAQSAVFSERLLAKAGLDADPLLSAI